MRLSWELGDNWFDREYTLVNSHDEVVEKLGKHPKLPQLREAERKYQTRIDLWQSGLLCSDCDNEINGRFGATPEGDMLCWECVSSIGTIGENDPITNSDPTDAVLSESKLHVKSLCDYVINVATGCKHGCRFCYVPTTPGLKGRSKMLSERTNIVDTQSDWGDYLLYRDDLPERLHTLLEKDSSWDFTERGRGVVMLSSGTDCYQDRRTAQITRDCVSELASHGHFVRILTRSPSVVRDIDLFNSHRELITIGSSIPTLDDDLVHAIEPNAPPPTTRLKALEELQEAGIRRFVSMSPTYPTMKRDDLEQVMSSLDSLNPEVVFHEPINPRGINFQMCVDAAEEAGRQELANEFRSLTDHDKWVRYALQQINTVQIIARRYDNLEVHSWPDRELVKATEGNLRIQLSDMRSAVSPEHFGKNIEKNDPSQSPLEEDPDVLLSQIR